MCHCIQTAFGDIIIWPWSMGTESNLPSLCLLFYEGEVFCALENLHRADELWLRFVLSDFFFPLDCDHIWTAGGMWGMGWNVDMFKLLTWPTLHACGRSAGSPSSANKHTLPGPCYWKSFQRTKENRHCWAQGWQTTVPLFLKLHTVWQTPTA